VALGYEVPLEASHSNRRNFKSATLAGRSNTESLNDIIPEILSDSEPLNFNIAINRAGRDVGRLASIFIWAFRALGAVARRSPMLSEGS